MSQSKKIEFNGSCLSQQEWSRRTGIAAGTISDRLKRGWTVEKALTAPAKKTGYMPERLYAQSDKCIGCLYGRPLYTKRDAPYYCAYLEITGCRRPWLAAECPGYGKIK